MMEVYGATAALQPVADHRVRPPAAGRGSRPPRQPRHRHLRGRGDGRRRPRGPLRPRQRAQPRPAAPDGDRRGGAAAAGQGGRDAGPARRVHRRRLQLRRPRLPVPAREAGRAHGPDDPLRRAGRLPEPDEGRVPVRLRRHRRHDAAAQDAHARPRLHPRADPRRRPALPRHGAAGVARLRARAGRGGGDPPDRVLRRRPPVRPPRGHRPGAGADPRHRRRHPRGQGVHGVGGGEGDPHRACAATATSTSPPTSPSSPAR